MRPGRARGDDRLLGPRDLRLRARRGSTGAARARARTSGSRPRARRGHRRPRPPRAPSSRSASAPTTKTVVVSRCSPKTSSNRGTAVGRKLGLRSHSGSPCVFRYAHRLSRSSETLATGFALTRRSGTGCARRGPSEHSTPDTTSSMPSTHRTTRGPAAIWSPIRARPTTEVITTVVASIDATDDVAVPRCSAAARHACPTQRGQRPSARSTGSAPGRASRLAGDRCARPTATTANAIAGQHGR